MLEFILCYTVLGLTMYDVYLLLQYHAEHFHCPKNPVFHLFTPPSYLTADNHQSFQRLSGLTFSRMSCTDSLPLMVG